MPLVKVGRKPEATYLQWLDVSAVADRIGAQKLADAENRKQRPLSLVTGNPTVINSGDIVGKWFSQPAYVALVPGSVFGSGGINHLRMNIATPRQTLKPALDSMAGALKELP